MFDNTMFPRWKNRNGSIGCNEVQSTICFIGLFIILSCIDSDLHLRDFINIKVKISVFLWLSMRFHFLDCWHNAGLFIS